MKRSVKAVAVLTLLCAVVAALLGTANYFTAGKIAENQERSRDEARSAVLPDGEYTFAEVSSARLPEGSSVTAAWEAKQNGETVAYVFQMETKGYASGLVLMCGISAEGRVTGTETVSSSETPSLGGKTERDAYKDQYVGLGENDLSSVDGISGATKTSLAYRNAVADAFLAYQIITGGER